MPRFTFASDVLRRGLALARIVKPETGDYCLRFSEDSAVFFSYDRRRYVRSVVPYASSSDVAPGYRSEDFYVTMDRVALFDTELETLSVTVGGKVLTIRAEGGGLCRTASLKPRSVRSRRPSVPGLPEAAPIMRADARPLDLLLKQVSCSALIRETKTEDDMRVNQVHFYSDPGCAVSVARYYGSVAYMPDISSDFSVVSSDVPLLRAFCTKTSGSSVTIHQDPDRIHVVDPSTGSSISMSRVASKRPPFSVLQDAGYACSASISGSSLIKCLDWASLAVDGTQRIRLAVRPSSDGSGEVVLHNRSEEVSRLPCRVIHGDGFEADFPVRHLSTLVGYLDGDAVLNFGHKDMPTVLCVQSSEDGGSVRARHYVQSMVSR